MLQRKEVFPHVIEMNFQAGQRLGCNVYLVFDGPEWMLIDIGFDETVDEIVELIRQLDFPLSQVQDADRHACRRGPHSGPGQDQAVAQDPVIGHPPGGRAAGTGDRIKTFAEIAAQNIHLEMPPVKIDALVDEGDKIEIGRLKLEVWHTPGHTDSQLSFRMGDLLFSGDNIYRDGCVGAIDAHHGSDIPAFIQVAQAHSRERRQMAAPQPRPDLPQGQRPARQDDRPPRRLSAHGRLRHLRHRLAADGRMGQGIGRWQNAQLAVDRRELRCAASAFSKQH